MRGRITESINELTDEYVDEDTSPRAINNGMCMEFANDLCWEFDCLEIMKTKDVLGEIPDGYSPEPVHWWVTDGEYHYDAEEPEGVENWRSLPIFQRTPV